jgi:formylglycine-generating enzyme
MQYSIFPRLPRLKKKFRELFMKKHLFLLLISIILMMGCEENSTGSKVNNPGKPFNPEPANKSTDVSLAAVLSWECTDPDGESLTYDVYWGTDPTPDSGELVSNDQSGTSYNPGTMQYETTYYWKIVASDGENETESRVWSFTTSEETNYGDFIFVQGGTFNNGTSDVTVSSFYIGQYEVTQSEYQAVMGTNPAYFPGVTNGPVEWITWFDAIEYSNRRSIAEGITPCYSYSDYGTNPDDWPAGWNSSNGNHTNVTCNWTADGYRLPTEAEWHFAALGGNQTHNYTYSGSNNIDEVAWYFDNSGSTTHTVGTKAANELGTYDMSGNVWEWVWDIYGSYPGGSQTNPHGAVSGVYRVRRGGCWSNYAYYCTVSNRYGNYATNTNFNIGFRLCRISS